MEVFANQVWSTLSQPLGNLSTDTSMTLTTQLGAIVGTNEKMRFAILDASMNVSEVVYVTAINAYSATIDRAQDGTQMVTHAAGSRVEARVGKSSMDTLRSGDNTVQYSVAAPTANAHAVNLGFVKPLPPTVRVLTSPIYPSTGTYKINRIFYVPGGCSATINDTYSDGTNSYTVYTTVTNSNFVIMGSGTGIPASSGQLTRTGSPTITYTAVNSPVALKVRMVGGGGGGQGSGTAAGTTSATSGGATSFSTDATTPTLLLYCAGGQIGAWASQGGGSGGGGIIYAPAIGFSAYGSPGGSNSYNGSSGGPQSSGGGGGGTLLGGGTPAGAYGTTVGAAANPNSGAGGSGASGNGTAGMVTGQGGGGGGYIEAYIYNPDPSYQYVIGAGGTGGTAGTNGASGGAGADGIIIVEEIYA